MYITKVYEFIKCNITVMVFSLSSHQHSSLNGIIIINNSLSFQSNNKNKSPIGSTIGVNEKRLDWISGWIGSVVGLDQWLGWISGWMDVGERMQL